MQTPRGVRLNAGVDVRPRRPSAVTTNLHSLTQMQSTRNEERALGRVRSSFLVAFDRVLLVDLVGRDLQGRAQLSDAFTQRRDLALLVAAARGDEDQT